MAPVVFDTNILIDVLKGYEQALAELAHWDERYMSAMTWMEVLAGTDSAQEDRFSEILKAVDIAVVPITESIMNNAARLCAVGHRRGPEIHLPDAIIKATAAQ
ncbi:type II toxin-antitoxin system VapC family toxin [Massilia arenosa]|uniref:Type II toxin-antitoxin system VapC family toxin n=1 Tax=Zemynaea arenosa TaxID=2561931 RepID=A0A4Y9SHQ2_9BURK|nr:PIN domain-containing protein [Massilia arenosa]TFW21246.1 type II toxin-antitoxin system VapC family toxin [Massilia arenosa]